jgi:hypothetical protein
LGSVRVPPVVAVMVSELGTVKVRGVTGHALKWVVRDGRKDERRRTEEQPESIIAVEVGGRVDDNIA